MATLDEITVHPRDDAAPSRPPPAAEPVEPGAKPLFKSWRKKYRKMRVRFDERMRESNTLFREEHKAIALARRLQEQNDQLLDLLLDINGTAQVPLQLRYDLCDPSPSASSLEADIDADRDTIHRKLQEARAELAAGIISPRESSMRETALMNELSGIGAKSLASLLQVPHTRYPTDRLPDNLCGDVQPGYLSVSHEEEFLKELDNALADPSIYDANDTSGRPIRLPARDIPSDKELQIRNPDSVYNWLRKHQPQVFLQDKENEKEASDKPSGKGGTGRGGGKRGHAAATVATPSKVEHEADEDGGFAPEAGSGRGKRNKDDEPYRPKGGSSRSAKRKREDGDNGGGGGRGGRKKVARGGAAAAVAQG